MSSTTNLLFRKFTFDDDVSQNVQVKTSETRNIKKQLIKLYGDHVEGLAGELDAVMFPKKSPVYTLKCSNYVMMIKSMDEIFFFTTRTKGMYIPTLRTIHKYPDLLPRVHVDKGAVPFVLRGVNILSPGIPCIPEGLSKGDFVAVYGPDKKHAMAIGQMTMDSEEIKESNSGYCIDNLHIIGDGLWEQTKPGAGYIPSAGSTSKKKQRNDDSD